MVKLLCRLSVLLALFAGFVPVTEASRFVSISSQSCTQDTTGTHLSCKWSCGVQAFKWTIGGRCVGNCREEYDRQTGCTKQICCASTVEVDDNCCLVDPDAQFTEVTFYVKPPCFDCCISGVCR